MLGLMVMRVMVMWLRLMRVDGCGFPPFSPAPLTSLKVSHRKKITSHKGGHLMRSVLIIYL
jgi:hypothetical protein